MPVAIGRSADRGLVRPDGVETASTAPRPAGRWWAIYLAVGTAIALAYFFSHENVLFNLVGVSSPIAILVGIRLNRPTHAWPWLLFAAGQGLFWAGDIITYNYPAFFGTDVPFPSWGDPAYLAVYPCLVAGLLLVVRSRTPGRDTGNLIDSLIIAIGAGTISWVLLLSPIAGASDSTLDQKVIGLAYPILDLVLVGVVVRMLFGAGKRPLSLYLLATAAAAVLITDGAYSFISVQGIVYDHSGQLELGWAAFYLLWGAAALHGRMDQLTESTPDVEQPLTARRLMALAGATLLAEIVHAARDGVHGDVAEPFLYLVSGIMFILVIVRLAGLVQRQERSARRERALREAGASLVAATDREAVYDATIVAARKLVGPQSSIGVMSAAAGSGDLSLVASDGDTIEVLVESSRVSDAFRRRLLTSGFEVVPLGTAGAPHRTGVIGVAILLPLLVRGELRGLLGVTAPRRPAKAVIDGLATLAVQAALALESVEFAATVADRRSQQWFASLVQNASDVILVIEADTSIHFVSPACDRVLGYPPHDLMGRLLADFLQPADSAAFHARLDLIVRGRDISSEAIEFRMRHAHGHWLDVETIPANLLADPNVKGIVLTIRDVSERKAFEAQLSHQAFYDSLTGLANRALFQNRVDHAMARRRPRGVEPSVLFLDLDDFKNVNDSLGHTAGDRLLASVAARLQKCLRASDTAARLGGDEFAVLVEDSAVGSTELAVRVLAALAAPFDVDGTQVHVSASIGIATADHGQHGPEAVASLLRNADVAMYSAKGEGGAMWRAFEPVMLDAARRRLELKSALDRAVDRHELLLDFQPIVELASDDVRGVEALVRWMHPQRGLIAPLDFIPLAEETGQIVAIGDWVLREACRTAVVLHRAQPAMPPVYMAVNLSGHQLQRPEIVDEVADALASSGLAPELLQLEITESVLMRDIDQTIDRLRALKDLGVQLAIDDFGTGYSSLNHLRRFPVDVVKIDKSFVDGIEAGGDQRALVAMIIDLTLALGLRVVAEGIERPDQLLALRALGCDYGQGFLFARPVALPDLLPLLAVPLGAKPAA